MTSYRPRLRVSYRRSSITARSKNRETTGMISKAGGMATRTNIEWTEMTWNPVTGCTKVNPGCKHCYAETMSKRLKAMGAERYRNGFRVMLHNDLVDLPEKWKQSRVVFVNSMSDAIRFFSVEPLLGPIGRLPLDGIDWVIVGGESGAGAREMQSEWVETIYRQCRKRGVSFFFKQWGGVQKHRKGPALQDRADLRRDALGTMLIKELGSSESTMDENEIE